MYEELFVGNIPQMGKNKEEWSPGYYGYVRIADGRKQASQIIN